MNLTDCSEFSYLLLSNNRNCSNCLTKNMTWITSAKWRQMLPLNQGEIQASKYLMSWWNKWFCKKDFSKLTLGNMIHKKHLVIFLHLFLLEPAIWVWHKLIHFKAKDCIKQTNKQTQNCKRQMLLNIRLCA